MQWRFLDSGAGRGAFNMALDESILSEVERGASPPTVRIYGWNPACISLGHSQKAAGELDLDAVRARGYEVVVRPTGGRAVLHIDELTYSVIAPYGAAPWCATQASSYRMISQAVARALDHQGLGLTLDRGYPVEKPQGMRAMTPCFSSTARSEVVHGDRKVVGSAQRRFRAAFLQHGSILVSEGHRDMVACLRLEEGKRAEYLGILDRNAISLEAILGRRPDWRALAQGFLRRMAAGLEVEFREGGVTERESALAERGTAQRLAASEAEGSPAGGSAGAAARKEQVHA